MSALVVGLSHRSAPVALLERVAVPPDELAKAADELLAGQHLTEVLVLATCNRVEVYAEIDKFHGGVSEISATLARLSGLSLDELTAHLYVHYEDRAVQHLFTVACGLDSMVVGEAQVLGQLRTAVRTARVAGTIARELGPLVERALRVGKRAHAETGIDRAGRSLVTVGLQRGEPLLGGYTGRRAVVIGAGSMSALAGSTLRRYGVPAVTVVNRTPEHARRLARQLDGAGYGLDGLRAALADADVAVSCTGATGTVVDAETVAAAMAERPDRPLYLLDLALPRDIDPAVRGIPGVRLTDLETLHTVVESAEATRDVEDARRIVAEEVGTFLAEQRAARVAPTVVALRSKAEEVVGAELARLDGRLPDLDERVREEFAASVRRVVDKLLHAPTVRVKELAEGPAGDHYADALRELFGLDLAAVEAVGRADVAVEDEGR